MKTYALALPPAISPRYLDLPLMTLEQAEKARNKLAMKGHYVYVVNVRTV